MGYKNFLVDFQYSYLSSQFTDASNAPQDLGDNVSGIIGSKPFNFSIKTMRLIINNS